MRGNDLYSASPMQSPASENGPSSTGANRLGQRKGKDPSTITYDGSLTR
jgi:hypothetical protein